MPQELEIPDVAPEVPFDSSAATTVVTIFNKAIDAKIECTLLAYREVYEEKGWEIFTDEDTQVLPAQEPGDNEGKSK